MEYQRTVDFSVNFFLRERACTVGGEDEFAFFRIPVNDHTYGGVGLGCLLSQALKGAMTRYVFWQIVFFSAIIGILSFSVMGLLEYILCPYKRKAKSGKE